MLAPSREREMDEATLVKFGSDRIASRQIDELIGLARGLIADGALNQLEVEFLQKWLVANGSVSDQPVIRTLYVRINEILADGIVDENEMSELFDTLNCLSNSDFELGETLKATSLPLNSPAPKLTFSGQSYCFTGTFNFGQRKHCEQAVIERGASIAGLSLKTNVLVIGVYATDSWKHSSFGNKILSACQLRDRGHPIAIVSEEHWVKHL
jgi:NAD-dependent DNA ligase